MHLVAEKSGMAFASVYGGKNKKVIDVGGLNVNGSLRKFFEDKGMTYICVDMEKHPSVDILVKPGEKMPFDDGSIDLIISTSCFEHDPCFWMTFKEMSRIIKSDGYIYINAPSIGSYHTHPGDNWRFYSDAGQALAYWSGIQVGNEDVFPVKIVETFHIDGNYKSHRWDDFVCIWKRTDVKETEIKVTDEIISYIGPVEQLLHINKINTKKKITPTLR